MPNIQTGKLPEALVQATVNIWGPGTNGTGFLCPCPFIDVNNAFLVVSNKHVLEGFNEKNVNILLSQPANECYTSLCPLSNIVYSHPSENIDLACVIAHQSVHVESAGRFHLEGLTRDYFSEPTSPIPSGGKLTTVGYPRGKSRPHKPLIQDGHLVCDTNTEKHQLAIKPIQLEGTSGSPVFIQSAGRFFVVGVVERRNDKLGLGIIIKQHYVSELLDFAEESFKSRYIRLSC